VQSPFPSAHTYRSARPSDTRSYLPSIFLIFLLIVVLAGSVSTVSHASRSNAEDGGANHQIGYSVTTVVGTTTDMTGKDHPQDSNHMLARNPGGVDSPNFNDLFVSKGVSNGLFDKPRAAVASAAPLVPPSITVAGSCDTFGNSIFTITNIGGAMTSNYTWELYQNNVFLTSGVFQLAASPGPGNSLQLTINGLYGNLAVAIKNGTTPAAVEIARATAFCVERPTVAVRQAVGQADPTTSTPIKFDVTFSKPVNDFTSSDLNIAGMAATPGKTVTDSGDHKSSPPRSPAWLTGKRWWQLFLKTRPTTRMELATGFRHT
jgi:hypothetical protein